MDWNNDGKHDLLVGDSNGNVRVYLNTNTKTKPILDGGTYIIANREPLNAGERATPVVDDWNSDGKKDLLIGSMDGTIKIYLNKGTDSFPVFSSPSLLQVGEKDFYLGSRVAPRIYDWDKDGLKDILIGEMEGYVYFLKNVGTNDVPVFNKSVKLLLGNGDFLKYPDTEDYPRSRVFIADWNNDSLADILLGGRDGKVMLYLSSLKISASPQVLAKRTWNQFRERVSILKSNSLEKLRELKKRYNN